MSTFPRIQARTLLIGLLLLAAASSATAQVRDWNRVDDPLYEAIGMHMGLSGGFGLSYKFPIQWWLYGQVAGGIWNNKDDNRHNGGVSLQYILRQSGRDKLYLGAGLAHFYHKENDRTKDHINLGFGVGLERLMGERTAVQVEAVFTSRGDDENSLMIFPQVGVHYYF
ncbi:hypothetical protein H8E07_08005 [bacterium]|nr:hypothetical protein [bacterium]